MSRDVVTVRPETPLREVAELLASRHLSGVPVVDAEGRLLGVLTESDLMRRIAAPAEAPAGFLGGLIRDAAAEAGRFAKLHGRTAQDVMTPDPLCVPPDAPVAEVAKLLEEKRIRRLPVVSEGRLLGLVSRADILKAVLAAPEAGGGAADDAAIRAALRRAMREQPWVDRHFLHAEVRDGHVHFTGFARSPTIAQGLRALAESIPGVRSVSLDLAPPPLFMMGIP
ncbi:CBS domain-containing protein [Rubritepida flocculans]|uniref:CBS domain-containing protein n=1 Tax=Rubritepida flocculans TaxID=182403 RepID=UPI00056A4F99|nr:CBS domain-containing protein [Rubritepida flocculans]